jgi:hypothetical protein
MEVTTQNLFSENLTAQCFQELNSVQDTIRTESAISKRLEQQQQHISLRTLESQQPKEKELNARVSQLEDLLKRERILVEHLSGVKLEATRSLKQPMNSETSSHRERSNLLTYVPLDTSTNADESRTHSIWVEDREEDPDEAGSASGYECTEANNNLGVVEDLSEGEAGALEHEGETPKSENQENVLNKQKQIRVQAAKMLVWASRAIERGRSSPASAIGSQVSGDGTDFRPFDASHRRGLADLGDIVEADATEATRGVVISNIDRMEGLVGCSCHASLLSGNAQHDDFYLPTLAMACTCGKQQAVFRDGADFCALSNILRHWQVEFLNSVGVNGADEFVHLQNHHGHVLAKQLRQWRREKNLASIKTKSCAVALHIWSRTCSAVMQSFRQQRVSGIHRPKRPDFLAAASLENRSVSTLGFDSARFDVGSLGEV